MMHSIMGERYTNGEKEKLIPKVLLSAKEDLTNPYLQQLTENVDGFQFSYFNWREAFFGSYRIFHVHWPEHLSVASTRMKTSIKAVAAILLIFRLVLFRVKIVRTLHNLVPHDGRTVSERIVTAAIDRLTSATILLNNTPAPARGLVVVIPHPNYDVSVAQSLSFTHAAVCFGLIRPYKGIESFIEAANALDGGSSIVLGKPLDTAYGEAIRVLCSRSENVASQLGHVPQPELESVVRASRLTVLPYRKFYNSGAAMLSLSLGTPILIPRCSSADELRREFGPNWVKTFTWPLTASSLKGALEEVRVVGRQPAPEFAERNWKVGAQSHERLYTALLA